MKVKQIFSQAEKRVVIDFNKCRHSIYYKIDDTDPKNKRVLELTDVVAELVAFDAAMSAMGTLKIENGIYKIAEEFAVTCSVDALVKELKAIVHFLETDEELTETDGFIESD